MAGGSSQGYGSAADLGTAFNVEHSLFHTSTIGVEGNLGYGTGMPDGVIRASYRRPGNEGWTPTIALIVRRFATPDSVPHRGALEAVAFTYSDGFSIGDVLDFQIASEAQNIQFLGHGAMAFRPSAVADWHLTSNTILEYRYATSEPNTRASKGFDSAPADLSETGPRMTMIDGQPLLENAHHHEISLSQRAGDNKLQIAYFRDRIKDPALLGVGDVGWTTDDILPDVYSGTFSFNGGALDAQGVRVVFQRRLSDSVTATFDYAYGGVLELEQPNVGWNDVRSMPTSGSPSNSVRSAVSFRPRLAALAQTEGGGAVKTGPFVDHAQQYAAGAIFGVPVAPVATWAPRPDGTCTCPRGSPCASPGKHPVERGWIESSTTEAEQVAEAVARDRWKRPTANIAVLHGTRTVDLEIDGDNAAINFGSWLSEQGQQEPATLTYTSGGVGIRRHLIFAMPVSGEIPRSVGPADPFLGIGVELRARLGTPPPCLRASTPAGSSTASASSAPCWRSRSGWCRRPGRSPRRWHRRRRDSRLSTGQPLGPARAWRSRSTPCSAPSAEVATPP